jgi:hypothetical protein
MKPIHIFIDTSAMPRDLARIGHEFNQLADLAGAKLIKVHMSDIAIREWRSQMVAEYMKLVKKMHAGLRAVFHQPLTSKLTQHKLISQLVADRKTIFAEATAVADGACDEFLKRLRVGTVIIDASDAGEVFDAYFDGDLPFGQPKQRIDIPDAFIFQAASRLLPTLPAHGMLALCGDGRLSKTLAGLLTVQVFESAKVFLQSDVAKEAMTHLELYRVWTDKEEQVIKFLARQSKFVENKINDFVSETLPGYTITDNSIPVDNNEATIGYVQDVRDLEFGWDAVEQPGPGWVTVPFEFVCDANLDLLVFRSDAFSMPDWIHVSIGDFEEDYFFEGEADREIRVRGRLSFLYTKDELEASKLKLPASVEIEDDIDVELIDDVPSEEM